MARDTVILGRLPSIGGIDPWKKIGGKFKRTGKFYFRELALLSQRYIEGLNSKKLKILFSIKKEWELDIRRDFRYTGHELSFKSFLDANLAQYDLLVPLTIEDLEYLQDKNHLVANNPIPIPSLKSLQICNDKYLFHQKLVEGGYENYLPKISSQLPYPYILKKKVDEWGINSHIICNKEDELRYSQSLSSKEYFRQELIPGKEEYTTHLLFSKGKIVCSSNIEYAFKRDFFIKGKGESPVTRQIEQSPHLPLFASILDLIMFEGLCCFNYKIMDDRPIIFEINPRFGGSLRDHFYEFVRNLYSQGPA